MNLTPKSKNVSKWYNEVILKAELADYSPVKGCMVIRPDGYSIWENVQRIFDAEIKKAGVRNAYFPIFIPMSFLEKEKEHAKGFSPELAVVTKGGGEDLAEPLAVRPTSETIMYHQFSKWIQSYRDLPMKINQWNNVVRWEKRTYLFLRTSEFLWQEAHTAHATHKEAVEEAERALKSYIDLYKNHFAIYGIAGIKSKSEKFAGAEKTYTYEVLLPGGKALQAGTTHDLGQNFSKPFEVNFTDKNGKLDYVWQTSWGLSTRSIGGLILTHGDDNGLVIPPDLAYLQIVIVPVLSKSKEDTELISKSWEIKANLEKIYRVGLDERQEHTYGWKLNELELKGIPVRIELGKKEIEEQSATVYRRDLGTKEKVKFNNLEKYIEILLKDIQDGLFEKSREFTKANTHRVGAYDQFKEIMRTSRGFIEAFWCESEDCEMKIKEETKATTRCLPLDAKTEKGKCIYCGKESSRRWVFAQAY